MGSVGKLGKASKITIRKKSGEVQQTVSKGGSSGSSSSGGSGQIAVTRPVEGGGTVTVTRSGKVTYQDEKGNVISREQADQSSAQEFVKEQSKVIQEQAEAKKIYGRAQRAVQQGRTGTEQFRQDIATLNRLGVTTGDTGRLEFSKQSEQEMNRIIERTSRAQLEKLAGREFDEGVKNIRVTGGQEARKIALEQRGAAGITGPLSFIQPPDEGFPSRRETFEKLKQLPREERNFSIPEDRAQIEEERRAKEQLTKEELIRGKKVGGIINPASKEEISGKRKAQVKTFLDTFKSGFFQEFRQPEQNVDVFAAGALFGIIGSGGVGGKIGSNITKAPRVITTAARAISKSKPVQLIKTVSNSKPIQFVRKVSTPLTQLSKRSGGVLGKMQNTQLGNLALGVGDYAITGEGIRLVGAGAERLTRKKDLPFSEITLKQAVKEASKAEERKVGEGAGLFKKAKTAFINEIPFTGDRRAYEQSLRKSAKKAGLGKQDTERFVQEGFRRRSFTEGTVTAQLIGLEAVSESIGRSTFSLLGKKAPIVGKNIGLRTFGRGVGVIVPIGALEGSGQLLAERRTRGEKVSAKELAFAGGFGAAFGGILGGAIPGLGAAAVTRTGAKKAGFKVLEKGATWIGNIADPFEIAGDTLEKATRRSRLFVRGGKDVSPVITLSTDTKTAALTTKEKKVKPFTQEALFGKKKFNLFTPTNVLSEQKAQVSNKQALQTLFGTQTDVRAQTTARTNLETLLETKQQAAIKTTGGKTPISAPIINFAGFSSVNTKTDTKTNTKQQAETEQDTKTQVPTSVASAVSVFSPQPKLLSPFLPPIFPRTASGGGARKRTGRVINELELGFSLFRTQLNGRKKVKNIRVMANGQTKKKEKKKKRKNKKDELKELNETFKRIIS